MGIYRVRLACKRSGLEPLSRQTSVVKTDSDILIVNRSATGLKATGPRR